MRHAGSCLIVAAMAFGCGSNSAQNFVGSYGVSGSFSFSSLPTSQVSGTQTITTSAEADQIVIASGTNPGEGAGANCNVLATVNSSTAFTIVSVTCPAYTLMSSTCGSCSNVLIYTGGSGTLAGTTLTVAAQGNYSEICNGCSGTVSGTFSENFKGDKS
jgi:hypothetical protein